MFQRLRDWWTLNSKSAFSPECAAAMERKMPGFRARQAQAAKATQDRRQYETEWWDSVVAMQAAGRIKQAEEHTLAHMAELSRFVLEPLERLAMLYAREVDRLLSLGDRAGAEAAANEASRWMGIWASHSTSGGEGTARSSAGARMEAELRGKLDAVALPR